MFLHDTVEFHNYHAYVRKKTSLWLLWTSYGRIDS